MKITETYMGQYLGATDDERLNPALESFVNRSLERLLRASDLFGAFTKAQLIATSVESWLIANTNEQPLWPKDYQPEGFFVLHTGDRRPDWMKRKWV